MRGGSITLQQKVAQSSTTKQCTTVAHACLHIDAKQFTVRRISFRVPLLLTRAESFLPLPASLPPDDARETAGLTRRGRSPLR